MSQRKWRNARAAGSVQRSDCSRHAAACTDLASNAAHFTQACSCAQAQGALAAIELLLSIAIRCGLSRPRLAPSELQHAGAIDYNSKVMRALKVKRAETGVALAHVCVTLGHACVKLHVTQVPQVPVQPCVQAEVLALQMLPGGARLHRGCRGRGKARRPFACHEKVLHSNSSLTPADL